MDNVAITKDNKEIEVALIDKRKTRRRYESIARAYSEYLRKNAGKAPRRAPPMRK